jgi:putative sigma-54 modulation protein
VARLRIAIRGKNVDTTPPVRDYLSKRLSKVERHFGSDVGINVSLSKDVAGYGAEITVPINGLLIRSEETAGDLYSAIDLAVDKLVRQVDRYRKRLQGRRQSLSIKQMPFISEIESGPDEGVEQNGEIVRVKRFAFKPMPVEEAVLQMNLLGHDFFVFTNSESSQVSVVYRRNDGNYGLIEPES